MEEAYGEPGESKLEETGLASKNGDSCQLPGMSNGGAAASEFCVHERARSSFRPDCYDSPAIAYPRQLAGISILRGQPSLFKFTFTRLAIRFLHTFVV